jgi:hypothetical protein
VRHAVVVLQCPLHVVLDDEGGRDGKAVTHREEAVRQLSYNGQREESEIIYIYIERERPYDSCGMDTGRGFRDVKPMHIYIYIYIYRERERPYDSWGTNRR